MSAVIKRQNEIYLNKNISDAFHVLSVSGSYKLIGSSKIRNFLYSNDYDLNELLQVKDTSIVTKHLVKEFQKVFDKAHAHTNYYILDFKCGADDQNEPLRWSYQDIKQAYKTVRKKKYYLGDCLLMSDQVTKLDLCLVVNGVFTEITNNYFIHTDKNKLPLSKALHIKPLQENIDKLFKEKQFFKCLKRAFSLEVIEGNIDTDLLNFLNSDFGTLYKTIHELHLVLKMNQQHFKYINKATILNNLEVIKAFTSHITKFDVDTILDSINLIIKNFTDQKLEQLISYSENYLNELTKPHMKKYL